MNEEKILEKAKAESRLYGPTASVIGEPVIVYCEKLSDRHSLYYYRDKIIGVAYNDAKDQKLCYWEKKLDFAVVNARNILISRQELDTRIEAILAEESRFRANNSPQQ